MRLLLAGLFLNSMAHVPFVLLQSVNRPDLPGKLHLLELVPYIGAVAFAIRHYGITGAATVWSLRLSIEAMLLLYMAAKTLVPGAIPQKFKLLVLGATVLLGLSTQVNGLAYKSVACILVLGVFLFVVWQLILGAQERVLIGRQLEVIFKWNQSSHAAGTGIRN